jgi:enoyl-CoA hydratase
MTSTNETSNKMAKVSSSNAPSDLTSGLSAELPVMTYDERTLEAGRVAIVLTIDRPKALNALNAKVLGELENYFEKIEARLKLGQQPLLAGVVIAGSGAKAFVAGADISEIDQIVVGGGQQFAERGQKLFRNISRLSVPVIACVQGFALGGGCELAMACDFIFASSEAKFGLPECSLGIMPGFGGTVRLTRRVGAAKALELSMSGQMISGEEAYRIGLVNQFFKEGEVVEHALKYLSVVATKAPLAIGYIKRAILDGENLSGEASDQLEAKYFAKCHGTLDQKEGTAAFLAKRKPVFLGK